MCNLYSLTAPADALRRLFAVAPEDDRLGNLAPLPAIFPRHDAPVLRLDAGGRRSLVPMHWGLLMPQVSKKTGRPILPRAVNNARDDRLTDSPFWRESFAARRCLIPATAFCEAQGRAPATYWWFALEGEAPRPPFAFAGIWRRFRGRYREEAPVEIDTFSMITTRPNPLVAEVHPDRMPAILPLEAWEPWLHTDPAEALRLIAPFPAGRMRVVRRGREEKADPAPA